ncbi:hypothetical protein WICPIJ_002460 [Wickerhamomyces pijperi]|uniref:Amino acid transporter transmembrane domain-containing protein n=1 Tax=Wickerhamomyces pijperi TaxID=599730 RepID=A0A9P8QBN7_WICPI|nr:hypothetical protein WICPIJ_002460 [Wickerhamomyces pijperi]
MSAASTTSSIINLTKTIIGAGLLAIPYGFKSQGIFFGVILILVGAIASSYGLYIIGRCSYKLPRGEETSFFTLCSITYPQLSLIFDFSIFIQCFGVAVSYLILVGDLLPQLLNDAVTRTQVILLSLLITTPLISFRKLDSLKIGSLIGLLSIVYLVVLVVSHTLLDDLSLTQGNIKYFTTGSLSEILASFPIVIFAFTAAQNISTVINEIENKNDLNLVILAANGIAGGFFVLVGVMGYLQFGDNVQGNIILAYDPTLLSTKIGQFALLLMVVLSYPLMFHPARISLNNMIFWIETELIQSAGKPEEETQPLLQEQANVVDQVATGVPFSDRRFVTLSLVLSLLTYGCALTIRSFELVLALVGATGSTLICFILPGLFGFKLSQQKWWSLGLSLWGGAVMIASVYSILYL